MNTTPGKEDDEELTWEDLVERDILEDLDKVTKNRDDKPIRISVDARNWLFVPMHTMSAAEIEAARAAWDMSEYEKIQDPEWRGEFGYEAEKAFERSLKAKTEKHDNQQPD
jgi:hypothetical protein